MPVYTPIPVPSTAEPKPVELKPEQISMRDTVLEHFSKADYTLPDVEKGELLEEEKFWLSHECILRYLRAVKWASAEKAILRLENTLRWRREFGLYDALTSELVEPEGLTGKIFLFGYDTAGRPACYMVPSRQNTEEGPGQIQYTVWMLERCADLMAPGVETLNIMLNFGDRGKNPSFATSRLVLNILQDHYPERLGLGLMTNIPFIVNAFLKLIMPFVDAATRPKLHFNPHVLEDGTFAPDMLVQSAWGGDHDFVYDHEKYWPALVTLCKERKKAQLESWRALGGKVGLKEWDVKRAAIQESHLWPMDEKALEGAVESVIAPAPAIETVA